MNMIHKRLGRKDAKIDKIKHEMTQAQIKAGNTLLMSLDGIISKLSGPR